MLEIQKFIALNGLEGLSALGINVYEHPTKPLVGCKYSTIDSPRDHPVVKEARGIVLERDTWKVVAKPFNRFFNVGEFAEDYAKFDWGNFTCREKVDGSIIILYYYDGEWEVNTSGSFGFGRAHHYTGSWRELFWKHVNLDRATLARSCTYLFELCTPWNEVVKVYEKPTVFLLGITHTRENIEFSEGTLDVAARFFGLERPQKFEVANQAEVAALIASLESTPEVNEGVILRDATNRWKWKTQRYCANHILKGNGSIIHPKRLLSIVLAGEKEDVLGDLPRLRTALEKVSTRVEGLKTDIWATWEAHKDIESQKEFALAIATHEFKWVLFAMRKAGNPHPSFITDTLRSHNDKVATMLFAEEEFIFDY